MDGDSDVVMVDSDAVQDAPPPPSSGYAVSDSADTGVSSEVSESKGGMGGDMQQQQPQSMAPRTRSNNAELSCIQTSEKDDAAGYTSNDRVVNSEAIKVLATISDEQLLSRARSMLTSVADGPVASGECGITSGFIYYASRCDDAGAKEERTTGG